MPTLSANDIFTHTNNKLQMRDIFAIYSHDWDVIGEMVQNAVDAVLKRRESSEGLEYIPTISITYNLAERSISVRDNGAGMSANDSIKAVAPNYSGKNPKGTNRGEFGVGLSFIAFSANSFQLETCAQNKHTTVSVLNGYDWSIDEENTVELEIHQETDNCDSESFTEIRVKPARFPEFSQKKLVYILQRLTAVGDFWAAFNDEVGTINVSLTYIDRDGTSNNISVPNKLWHPADHFDLVDRETIDYSKIKEIDEGTRNEAIPNMIGFGMVRKDKIIKEDREFAYYALFCFSDIYREIAKAAGIVEEETAVDEDDDLEEEGGTQLIVTPEIDLYPGIYACKKGMPLGGEVPRPPRQSTGLWWAYYIIVHSDDLQTEPGRKKLNIPDERLVQSVAKSVYREMEKYSSYVISKTNPDANQEAILRELESNRRLMSDWQRTNPLTNIIPSVDIPAVVEPVNEQTLIGVFHELIGAGVLKGYKLLKLSATDTYDGLYNYSIPASEIGNRAFKSWLSTLPNAAETRRYTKAQILEDEMMVVEFKLKLESILKDFLQKSKYHLSIRLLVAWDANEKAITRRGWHLQKLPTSEVRYYGANYILRPSSEGQSKGILATHVLLVKRFLESIAEKAETKAEPASVS